LCALLVAGCDEVWSIDHVDYAGDDDAQANVSCAQDPHDEDCDGFPDASDRCPGVADDQTDADGDGLGDACDPSGTTNERVELFISFADPAQTWNVLAGDWHPHADSYVYSSVAFANSGIARFTGVVPEPPFWIEVHFRVDAIDVQVSQFLVVVDADPAGDGVACGHDRQVNPLVDRVRATYAHATTGNEIDIMTVAPGEYRVLATYDRTSKIHCTLRADDNSTSGTTMASASPPQPGALAVRSFRIGATVHWIAVYKTY